MQLHLIANRPDRTPKFIELDANDSRRHLIEKIRRIELEIVEQYAKLAFYLFSIPYEDGRRKYKHFKSLIKTADSLVDEYHTAKPGAMGPHNLVDISYLDGLPANLKLALQFIGADQRRKRALNGKLIVIDQCTGLPDLCVLTFVKNEKIYRFCIQNSKINFIEDLVLKLNQYVDTFNGRVPDLFLNLSTEVKWHSLKVPNLPEDISYQITFSPNQLEELIRQNEFQKIEDFFSNFNHPWERVQRLKFVFNRFSDSEKDELFLKVKGFVNQCRALIRVIDFEKSKVVQEAYRFLFENPEHLGDLGLLLEIAPVKKLENPQSKDMIALVYYGAIAHVQNMLEKGMSVSVQETVYGESFGTQRRTVGAALLFYFYRLDNNYKCDPVKLIDLLVQYGLDVNLPVEYMNKMRSPLEVIVTEYYKEKRYHEYVKALLKCNTKPSQEVQQFWIARAHIPEYRPYLDYLKDKGCLNQQEYDIIVNPLKNKNVFDLSLAIHHRYYLEKMQKLAHLNRAALDLHKIQTIHEYKKTFKEVYLRNPHKYESVYRAFVHAYDKVISQHVLLNELREISRDLRRQLKNEPGKRDFAHRTISFLSAWHYGRDTLSGTTKLQMLLNKERLILWSDCYKKVLSAAERLKNDKYLSRHQITWLHGTKSSSLPCILKLKQILSMGDLLSKDIVTFSGEHCGSDRDNDHKVNSENVSGEKPSRTWNDGQNGLYYNAPTRTMLTRYYAEHVHNATNTLDFNEKEALERISIPHVTQLFNVRDFYRRHGVFIRIRFEVLRLRSVGAKVDDKIAFLKAFLQEQLKKLTEPNDISDVRLILDAIEKPLTMTFDNDDLSYMTDPQPYGIVFGSTKVDSTSYIPEKCDDPSEYLVKSPVHFKKDIQVAFTRSDKIEDLRKKLQPFGIRVYDFEMAMVQELTNMAINTRCEEYKQTLSGLDPMVSSQLELANELQEKILPVYATHYPRNPSYKEGTSKFVLDEPGYEAHLKSVENGEIVARPIHGPMHSCRGAIWTLVIHRMNERILNQSKCVPKAIQKAFSMHDIMRQNEGKDYWDRSSARFYTTHRIVNDISLKGLEKLSFALANKDPVDGKFLNNFHEEIHDADVVEIYPRAVFDIKDFRREELCILKKPANGILDAHRNVMIDEMLYFNKVTNNLRLHLHLETGVDNYYAELMRIIKYLYEKHTQMLLVYSAINEEVDAFCNKQIDPRTVELLEISED